MGRRGINRSKHPVPFVVAVVRWHWNCVETETANMNSIVTWNLEFVFRGGAAMKCLSLTVPAPSTIGDRSVRVTDDTEGGRSCPLLHRGRVKYSCIHTFLKAYEWFMKAYVDSAVMKAVFVNVMRGCSEINGRNWKQMLFISHKWLFTHYSFAALPFTDWEDVWRLISDLFCPEVWLTGAGCQTVSRELTNHLSATSPGVRFLIEGSRRQKRSAAQ